MPCLCFPHPLLHIHTPLVPQEWYVVPCALWHTFPIPMPSFFSVSGIDQLVLCCCGHIVNAIGPKIIVLEGDVGCSEISGSCMRLDVGPVLTVSCQFSKLIKNLLIICYKSVMFDDGVICLCQSARDSLYHLSQWVIHVSVFLFLGCGVFPDDVG